MKKALSYIAAATLSLSQQNYAQPIGWVLWGHEDSKSEYTSGRIKALEKWWIEDAFENFTQCKKNALAKTEKGIKDEKGIKAQKEKVQGPFIDNAGAWFSYNHEFSEEEQKKSLDRLIEFAKEAKISDEDFKRYGPVRTSWGTVKYICLPGGTDPRPREKE